MRALVYLSKNRVLGRVQVMTNNRLGGAGGVVSREGDAVQRNRIAGAIPA